MCHPGLPCPQGDSQWGSCGLDAFHRAKSLGSLLSWAPKIQETVKYSTLFRLAFLYMLIMKIWLLLTTDSKFNSNMILAQ